MKQAKTESKTKPAMPGDVETLCAILARIVERIAQSPAPNPIEG
jgi:hypothetical protein